MVVNRQMAFPVPQEWEAGAELFNQVSVGRIPGLIVEQIRGLTRRGQLKPGDRLPAERDLCKRFGTCRATVREALRMLESRGLVEIRVGAGGGAFVTAPSGNAMSEGLIDLLTMSVISAAHVSEVRMLFETGIVPLVCERATEEDFADLEKICERSAGALREGACSVETSLEFHARVAQATHNVAQGLLAESFRGPILMSLREAGAAAAETDCTAIWEHKQFIAAIRRRNTDEASHIMRTHLARTG
jgi:GntR family transcriptional repressor for pyruvate dehydrogenase complex